MQPWRTGAAIGIVAGLGAALVMLLIEPGAPTEDPAAVAVSTAARPKPTTTSTTEPTVEATTTITSHSERVEEVRRTIQDLYYGWFDAIYRKDPDALWNVVATRQYHEDGLRGMETLDFVAPPTREGIVVSGVEILLDRPDCLVVYSEPDFTAFRGPGATTSGVHVLWPTGSRWRFATAWWNKVDFWINDCDLRERPVVP